MKRCGYAAGGAREARGASARLTVGERARGATAATTTRGETAAKAGLLTRTTALTQIAQGTDVLCEIGCVWMSGSKATAAATSTTSTNAARRMVCIRIHVSGALPPLFRWNKP